MNKITEEINLAEQVITEYISNLSRPSLYLGKGQKAHFKQESYSKWAAKEVLRCVKEQDNRHPIDVIEDFVRRMDRYSCLNSEQSFIFSIAHDTGMSILDLFL